MTGREAKKQYLIREWIGKFRERAQSGQTVQAWCADNGVNPRSYYYWLGKIRECAAQVMDAKESGSAADLMPVAEVKELPAPLAPASTERRAPEGWAVCALPELPEPPTSPTKTLPIEIGKCRVMADADVDPELLRKVCKALMNLC